MILRKLKVETQDGYRQFALEDREAAEAFAKEIGSIVENCEEIISDPPPPIPDWQLFLDRLDVPERGGTGIFQAMLGRDNVWAWSLYGLIQVLIANQSTVDSKEWITFQYRYFAEVLPVLSDEQKGAIAEVFKECNIPAIAPS